MRTDVQQRFWSKVDKTGDCWLWTGAKNNSGYGTVRVDGKTQCAHRVAWEWLKGPLPEGKTQLDHRCFVKHCVNPAHLRPVTRKENYENLQGAYQNSSTGERGVFPRGARFRAGVRHNGKMHWLGMYDTVEEAMKVAERKRIELFTNV